MSLGLLIFVWLSASEFSVYFVYWLFCFLDLLYVDLQYCYIEKSSRFLFFLSPPCSPPGATLRWDVTINNSRIYYNWPYMVKLMKKACLKSKATMDVHSTCILSNAWQQESDRWVKNAAWKQQTLEHVVSVSLFVISGRYFQNKTHTVKLGPACSLRSPVILRLT